MHEKKVILVLIILLLVISVLQTFTMVTLTGQAITGTVSFCMNHPPQITQTDDQSHDHNSLFTLQINASDDDNNNLHYYDNVSLFDINLTTGLINFTPSISDVGNHSIKITSNDYDSDCPISSTMTFNLEIYNLDPNITQNIPNQSWESDVWLTGLDLDDYFSDPENDSLNYSVIYGNNIEVTINSTNGVTFYPDAGWSGSTWAVFIANDTIAATRSNNITLIVGDNTPPEIVIHEPDTIEKSPNLKTTLKVSISEKGNIWYNLDNKGNKTLALSSSGSTTNLTLSYFGNHTLIIYANDLNGNLNSKNLNFTNILDTDGDGIADSEEQDEDNDGLNNSIDFLVGNASNINTNIENIKLKINGSDNCSQQFRGVTRLNFTNGTHPLLEFDYNFSEESKLILGEVIIEKQNSTASLGQILVKINLTNLTKTVYLDKVRNSGRICLKDAWIDDIEEISSGCNGTNEYLINCPGTKGRYGCSVTSSQYRLTNLVHSGAVEMLPEGEEEAAGEPEAAGTTAGGGGGGGGTKIIKKIEKIPGNFCEPKMSCGPWEPKKCSSETTQTRNCLQVLSGCTILKFVEERSCTCIPQWQCTIWLPEECPPEGIQERTCIDLNACSEEIDLPLTKECTPALPGAEEEKSNLLFIIETLVSKIKEKKIPLVGRAFGATSSVVIDYSWLWISIVLFLLAVLLVIYFLKRKSSKPPLN
jgi:hypothetical protein